MNSPKCPLKLLTQIQPIQGYAACDGPYCRVVTEFRESNSLKSSVTVCPAIPSWCSESRSQYPNFQNLSVLERDPLDGPSCPWWSIVGSVDPDSYYENKFYCSKRLNMSLQERSADFLLLKVVLWANIFLFFIVCRWNNRECFPTWTWFHFKL